MTITVESATISCRLGSNPTSRGDCRAEPSNRAASRRLPKASRCAAPYQIGRPEEPRHDSLTESQANCGPILAFPGPILAPSRLNLIAPRRSCPSSRKHSKFSPSRFRAAADVPRRNIFTIESAAVLCRLGSNPTSRGDRLAEPSNV